MTSHAPCEDLKHFLLLYASQTGQAKAIAEEIAESAPLHGLKADLYCLSLTDKRFCIERESCAVFVVSTTGDGEPPDTAVKFYRRISRHTLKKDHLENLKYTLLALGDSNYIKFCFFGRLLEQRLQALSAQSFYATGYGDDAFGIETGVDPWIQNLWPALRKQLGLNSVILNGFPFLSHDQKSVETETKNPFLKNSYIYPMESNNETALTLNDLSSLLKDCNVEKLRVPKLPYPSLAITFGKNTDAKVQYAPTDSILNSQASPLTKVKLIGGKKLTFGENVKDTLELTFQFEDTNISYQPGDSFGFICINPLDEVEMLLERLNLSYLAELPLILEIPEASITKRKLPVHIPPQLSLRDVFLHCVEIRSVPKKILLRVLAEFATDKQDKAALLYLSSQEGSKAYADCIRKPSLSILDVLMNYKSCLPPVERLLEYLPCLKPRFYSVASSPLENESLFRVVFNVLKMDSGEGRFKDRKGVCTGWLETLSADLQTVESKDVSVLTEKVLGLTLDENQSRIFVYKKQNLYFHLPENLECPIIMVGPGTGIAPFVGFLQHREKLMKMNENNARFGDVWLFYGCRYGERDFLYKTELHRLKSVGVLTHLVVSFSREESLTTNTKSKYVHESIRQHANDIVAAVHAGAQIFVCGDAKHMAHDVQKAFIESFQTSSGLSENEAKSFVGKLQEEHRYINDVCT